MYFDKDKTQLILDHSNHKLVEVIGDFVDLTHKKDTHYVGDCPGCGKKNGLEINTSKPIYKCFRCTVAGVNASTFLMKSQNMSFPQVLEHLNNKFSIIADEQPLKKKVKAKVKENKATSYLARMLEESGLTADDIKSPIVTIGDTKTTTEKEIFRSKTIDSHFKIVDGDDVIIEYYDLDGNPCKYEEVFKGKSTGKIKEYFRVRYQFPEEHKDKTDKPQKYKSPPGSTSFLYIPEKIREMYRTGQKIKRLFIQEGEKKAEKACKHGIWSVGISGIQNIAGRDKKLPEDLIKIIQKMDVEECILLFDSDWNDLSNNLKVNSYVEERPRNFFSAARNFKTYMYTLKNRGIYVETYIGNVKKNEKNDKGVDDLLTNTLKLTPDELLKDIEHLMNEPLLDGKYIKMHRIGTWSDNKLEELWCLNNVKSFAKLHFESLKHFPEFRIGKYAWRFNAKGEVESAQPIEPDEQFWEESIKKTGDNYKTVYEFMYENNLIFLQNRNFGRYKSIDGTTKFCQLEHPVVRIVDHQYIRDYVKDFIRKIGNKGVLEMLHRGGPQYLGPDKLSDLNYIVPAFEKPERDKQRFYFKSFVWEITETGTKQVEYTDVTYNIWEEEKHAFEPRLCATPLLDIQCVDDVFSYTVSPEGEKCQFLQFLINASDFTWRKERQIAAGETEITIEPAERYENIIHLVSKMSAIGYLLLSAKNKSVPRAVVAMDGKQSEVGESNGRSGKSLIGDALTQVIPTLYINGKTNDMDKDTFLWTEMTDKTKLVFIDDVRVNFNIEFLFPFITGDWKVNYKGGGRATIPFIKSPKIYIPTNHALNGQGGSFSARQWLIAFSDYYNETHQPKDDFGGLFFDDWDYLQWNLFWNLMANCLQIYLKFGVVQAPGERIEARQLRQQMGESFLAWADEFFSDEKHLDCKMARKAHLYDAYIKHSDLPPKLVSPTSFKNKIKAFCTWKGYDFNPHMYDPVSGKPKKYDKDGKPDLDDKSGGIEYFWIGTRPVTITETAVVTPENKVVPPDKKVKPF